MSGPSHGEAPLRVQGVHTTALAGGRLRGIPGSLAAAAAVVSFATAGCHAGRPAAARNVILISVDTLRADALGCYGNRAVRTPHIDALAKDGVLFRQAFSHAPSTLPSHASMMFSEPPWTLGVLRNGDTLPARPGALASALKALGYQTAAFTSLAVLDSSFGLAQGFDHYADEVSRDPDRPYLFADEVNGEVLPWLADHHRRPFFLFVHYSDPHEPYAHRNAPADVEVVLNDRPIASVCFLGRQRHRVALELRPGGNTLMFRALRAGRGPRAPRHWLHGLTVAEPAVRAAPVGAGTMTAAEAEFTDSLSFALDNPTRRPLATQATFQGSTVLARTDQKREYLREVEWVDTAVGELVAWLRAQDRYDDSLILLVADHGEGLGDHGTMGHETQLYLSQLRVPMILVDHSHKGLEVGATVSLLDLAPTVLAHLRAPRPGTWKGADLARALSAAAARPDVLSGTFFGRDPLTPTHRRLSVLRPPHHLILSLPADRQELYDIEADPGERRNLLEAAERPAALDELQGPLLALAREAEARLSSRKAPDLSPEQLERLKALGYLGGSEEP